MTKRERRGGVYYARKLEVYVRIKEITNWLFMSFYIHLIQ